MIEFINLLNLFTPGFFFALLFQRWTTKENFVLDWQYVLRSLLYSVCLISIVGILLLEANHFNFIVLQVIFLSINLLLIALNLKCKNFQKLVFGSFSVTGFSILFVLLMILNASLKTPVSNYIHGGQDQGVYINIANELAESGDIWIKDDLLKQVFSNPEADFLQKYFAILPSEKYKEDIYEGHRTPGYYIQNKEEGAIVPQFFHLHPIWMALSNMLLGQENTPYALFFFAMFAIPFFYLIINNFVKNKWISLFSVFLYSINIFTVWINRYPVSETMAFFFILTGFYYLYEIYQDKVASPKLESAILAGISFGLFAFTRGNGVVLLPFMVILYMLLPRKKEYIWAFNLYFAFLAWSTLHALKYSFPYYFDVSRAFGINFFPQDYFFWYFVFFFFFILFINLFYFYAKDLIGRSLVWLRSFPKKVYIAFFSVLAVLTFGLFMKKANDFFQAKLSVSIFNLGVIGDFVKKVILQNDTLEVALLQLIVLLTPLMFLCASVGIYKFYKHCKEGWMLLSLFAYMFAFEYLVVFSQPYLFYFGRYQFTVMYPLMFLFFGIFCKNYLQTKNYRLYLKHFLLIVITFSYLLPAWKNPIYAKTEFDGAYEGLRDMAQYIEGQNSFIFLDISFGFSSRLEAPLMYSFGKGSAVRNQELPQIYEEGEKLINILEKNVYVLREQKLDEESTYYEGLKLDLIAQGRLPFRASISSTKLPTQWEDSYGSYYLYQMLPDLASDQQTKKTFKVSAGTQLYKIEGAYDFVDGYFWTDGKMKIREVNIGQEGDTDYEEVYLAVKNAGYYPPELKLKMQVLINDEKICEYISEGKKSISLKKCEVPKKFYGKKVDIAISTNTWSPMELWPESSSDLRQLGIDFKELKIDFVR